MDGSVFWLAENPPIPLCTDQKFDDCTDYQATDTICVTSKEFSQMECQIPVDGQILEMTYSDTDFDRMEVKIDDQEIPNIPIDQPQNLSDSSLADSGFSDYPGLLQMPLLHISNNPSASQPDFYPSQDELRIPLLCKPIVCCEDNDSRSLLGRPLCEICHLNPCNTCLMHHLSRHTDLCYNCAASHFSKGHVCPLCPSKIVYIYMYNDI